MGFFDAFKKKETKQEAIIYSPITGRVEELSQCPDEVFGTGMLGQGVVITPSDNKVYAPVDGQIVSIFDTKHALGIVDGSGIEILIHVGLDTVKLNGQGFDAFVKTGDMVKKGVALLEFDAEYIQGQQLSLCTPVVITDQGDKKITKIQLGEIKAGEAMFSVE